MDQFDESPHYSDWRIRKHEYLKNFARTNALKLSLSLKYKQPHLSLSLSLNMSVCLSDFLSLSMRKIILKVDKPHTDNRFRNDTSSLF